jgi:hypothetical protein
MGGGNYGAVFLASKKREANAALAVKVVFSSSEDYFPPSFEVVLAKEFAKFGLGYRTHGEFHGFIRRSEGTVDDLRILLNGPDFAASPPVLLHSSVGWYAMDAFDMTVKDLIKGHHGIVKKTMKTLSSGLIALLNSAGEKGVVHADLHLGNLGIRNEGNVAPPPPQGGKPPTTRAEKQASKASLAKAIAKKIKEKFSLKFCDYSRSYTSKFAEKARYELQKIGLTPLLACQIGNLNDIAILCYFLRELVDENTTEDEEEKINMSKRCDSVISIAYEIFKGTNFVERGYDILKKYKEINPRNSSSENNYLLYDALFNAVEAVKNASDLPKFKLLNISHVCLDLYTHCDIIPRSIYNIGSPARIPDIPLLQITSQDEDVDDG